MPRKTLVTEFQVSWDIKIFISLLSQRILFESWKLEIDGRKGIFDVSRPLRRVRKARGER